MSGFASTSRPSAFSPYPSTSSPASRNHTVGGGASTLSSSYDSLRRNARSLESQLDSKLTRYSALASLIARGEDGDGDGYGGNGSGGRGYGRNGGVGGKGRNSDVGEEGQGEEEWKRLQSEVESLVEELRSTLASLDVHLSDPELPPSTLQLQTVQRHRDVLSDFERDFRRSRDNIRHAVDRREVVGRSRVRGEATAYQASDEEALLAERGRLDNSNNMIDSTLEQAYATLTDFRSQRQILTNATSRLSSTASQIPALNGIMNMIARRRRRDSIIMGVIMGVGTVGLLMVITR